MELFDLSPNKELDPEIAILVAGLEDSKREWIENLEEPTPDAMIWTWREGGPSIGSQILHMADCELYWFEQFLGGQPADRELEARLLTDQIKVDDGQWPIPPKEPLRWYLDLFDEVTQRSRKWLEGMSATRQVKGSTKTFTARWVVSHVLQHDAYHGGQAVLLHETYKRLGRN